MQVSKHESSIRMNSIRAVFHYQRRTVDKRFCVLSVEDFSLYSFSSAAARKQQNLLGHYAMKVKNSSQITTKGTIHPIMPIYVQLM